MEMIKFIRESANLSRKQFSDELHIPYRTVQDWELGNRKCPDYLVELIQYRLKDKMEENKMKYRKVTSIT